jgi:hypothetical protein
LPPWLSCRGAIKLAITLAQPTSSHMISHCLPASFPMAKKKEENRETNLKNKRELLSLQGVVSLSLLSHGRVNLASVGGHTRASTKPRESGLYDRSRVSYLSSTRRSFIYCSGGIRCGVCGALRATILCAITSVSLLATVVLWHGATSLVSSWD